MYSISKSRGGPDIMLVEHPEREREWGREQRQPWIYELRNIWEGETGTRQWAIETGWKCLNRNDQWLDQQNPLRICSETVRQRERDRDKDMDNEIMKIPESKWSVVWSAEPSKILLRASERERETETGIMQARMKIPEQKWSVVWSAESSKILLSASERERDRQRQGQGQWEKRWN